jgi:hypothetical protein
MRNRYLSFTLPNLHNSELAEINDAAASNRITA